MERPSRYLVQTDIRAGNLDDEEWGREVLGHDIVVGVNKAGGAGRQDDHEEEGAGRHDQGQVSDDTNAEGEGTGVRVRTRLRARGVRVTMRMRARGVRAGTRSRTAGRGWPVTPAVARAAAGAAPTSRPPWRRGGDRVGDRTMCWKDIATGRSPGCRGRELRGRGRERKRPGTTVQGCRCKRATMGRTMTRTLPTPDRTSRQG